MDRELIKALLKDSKRSLVAKALLVELYVKDVEGLNICLKHSSINSTLLNQAHKKAKKYYKRKLNSYTVLGRIINFIKSI